MFHFPPARWLATLLALAAACAWAQPAPAEPPALPYRSAFEGYRPYTQDKPLSWKEANETVRQRGGWRAYAKEAAGADAQEHAGHGDHAGHDAPAATQPPRKAQP
jgi:hypothetical protein